jgi:hypothetical protein
MGLLLQLTALSFAVPTAIAVSSGLWATGTVLALNAVVSFAVHAPGRVARTILDTLDNLLVIGWVAVNARLLVRPGPMPLKIGAALCAIGCAMLANVRLQCSLNSRRRIIMHAWMHILGVVGTVLLVSQSD